MGLNEHTVQLPSEVELNGKYFLEIMKVGVTFPIQTNNN